MLSKVFIALFGKQKYGWKYLKILLNKNLRRQITLNVKNYFEEIFLKLSKILISDEMTCFFCTVWHNYFCIKIKLTLGFHQNMTYEGCKVKQKIVLSLINREP
jgi:hypothetical protein